jgi:glycerol-3-phosphate dehydrogenase
VALIEARDYAAGTSSRSSKLIHGGLRYLEQLNFGLVREALRERGLLLNRLAPHLVKPVPFLLPLQHRVWERAYLGSGIALYDTLGGGRQVPAARHLTRGQALRIAPALRKDSFVGAIKYHDALVDDARHTMFLAHTAARFGAALATSVRATGFVREGERVTGVRAVDLESGDELVVRSRQVINATGVWTDDTQQMVGGRGQLEVRASKGIHLVVPRDRIQMNTGLATRTDRSVLFVIPWGRHWIIGTTDTDWKLGKAHPAASRVDIEYLLEQANRWLVWPLTHEDVEGVYAGLRPLLAGESEVTTRLSREHVVAAPVPGVVMIAGGKYTTYRVMARDAVDAAVRNLDWGRQVCDSVTAQIPLLGADGYRALWNQRFDIAERSGLHVVRIEHLLDRYGSCADDLLAMLADRPELAEPFPGADDYLLVEAAYAARAEAALHLEDVLTRRTRTSIEAWDRGLAAAEPVARVMAAELGWSEEQCTREVDHYRLRVQAERESQQQDDDLSADAARIGAPDLFPRYARE